MDGGSGRKLPLVATLTLIVIFLILSTSSASAARISGLVTDDNGARVPGATVTLSQNTSLYVLAPNNPFTADATGYYEFPSLPPGDYSLQADKDGFNSGTEMRILGDSDLTVNLKIPGYSANAVAPTLRQAFGTPTPVPMATPTATPKPSNTPVPLPTRAEEPGFGLLLALASLGAAVAIKRSG